MARWTLLVDQDNEKGATSEWRSSWSYSYQTPVSLDLEDEDQIDCVLVQKKSGGRQRV